MKASPRFLSSLLLIQCSSEAPLFSALHVCRPFQFFNVIVVFGRAGDGVA